MGPRLRGDDVGGWAAGARMWPSCDSDGLTSLWRGSWQRCPSNIWRAVAACDLGIIAVIVVLGLAAGWMVLQPYTYRYRLTVEIMTPEGLRSGSSVYEGKYVGNGSGV